MVHKIKNKELIGIVLAGRTLANTASITGGTSYDISRTLESIDLLKKSYDKSLQENAEKLKIKFTPTGEVDRRDPDYNEENLKLLEEAVKEIDETEIEINVYKVIPLQKIENVPIPPSVFMQLKFMFSE